MDPASIALAVPIAALGAGAFVAVRKMANVRTVNVTAPGGVSFATTGDASTETDALAVARQALGIAQEANERSSRVEAAMEALRDRERRLVLELAEARTEATTLRGRVTELEQARAEAQALRSRVLELEAELADVRAQLAAAAAAVTA